VSGAKSTGFLTRSGRFLFASTSAKPNREWWQQGARATAGSPSSEDASPLVNLVFTFRVNFCKADRETAH
jgi:hypothetical protein